ncbi:MAG: aminopeptidase N [Alphaproteobacteria bacterium]
MAEALNKPQTKYRKDYKEPDYTLNGVELEFDLDPERTVVTSTMKVERMVDAEGKAVPFELLGEDMELLNIAINGKPLEAKDFVKKEGGITILNPPANFELKIQNAINPKANTRLEGLYVSNNVFTTQNEPEGFRRITYYPDRPDIMTTFKTTIRGDKDKFPILLANGNPKERGELDDGRLFAVWEDPWPKPAHLYALVGGDLARVEDTFTTKSGREIKLAIHVEHGKEHQTKFALESLKKAMAWDEKAFGREYDLDVFNIVAVSDFNFGAMENKGLNIFNDRAVLADPQSANDADYANIERVVAHEYFHNWTGNRVCLKDWFNLTLKEGLTSYRDQEFSSDMRVRPVQRINDVMNLRAAQFPEDASPLSHSIRPDSYVSINNFYTSTVYKKGAEVIRMMERLTGKDGFRKGMDLYFARHDGQAVTCDEFVKAIADANPNVDLKQMMTWYHQSGTPEVKAEGKYDPKTKTYELKVSQKSGNKDNQPFLIPLEVGLLNQNGQELPLKLDGGKDELGTSCILRLENGEQVFKFTDVNEAPILSINRGFTAPVKLDVDYSAEEYRTLMAHDTDLFNRWEAGYQYSTKQLISMVKEIQNGETPKVDNKYIETLRGYLKDDSLDKAFIAKAITLPSEDYIAEQFKTIDPDAIHLARKTFSKAIASGLKEDLLQVYNNESSKDEYIPDASSSGRRSLRNATLSYLSQIDNDDKIKDLMARHYSDANNMNDREVGLRIMANQQGENGEKAVSDFYNRYKNETLAVNKWLSAQSTSDRPDTLDKVKDLTEHPAFDIKNPNKFRSLVGGFANNAALFHAKDGSGYNFVAEQIKKLDDINPHVAAKMASVFGNWRKFDSERQDLMKNTLHDIAAKPSISRNLYEIVSKTLGDENKTEKAKTVEIKQQEAKAKIKAIKEQKKNCAPNLSQIIKEKTR